MIKTTIKISPVIKTQDSKRFTKTIWLAVHNANQNYVDHIQAVVRDLAEPPGPVRYPIRWASEKQRKAYFATNGFGKGIPYKRKSQRAAAETFKVAYVIKTETEASFEITNNWSAAQYVWGRFNNTKYQQPFHSDTGWNKATVIRAKVRGFVRSTLARSVEKQVGADLASAKVLT